MVQIPQTFQQGVPSVPSPASQPNLGRAPTQAAEGAQQLGSQLQELGNRLFEQQVQEEVSQAELQVQQELSQLEQQALQSPNFRQAPENFREQARQRVNQVAESLNPVVQNQFRTRMFRQAATQTAQLRRNAVERSQEATEAAVNNELRSLAESFARSPTPQGRQVIEEQIDETAARLQQSAILTGPEVEAKAAETRAVAQAARVTQLVNEKDPDAAETALQNGRDITTDQKFTLQNRIDAVRRQNQEELGDMIGEIQAAVGDTGRIPRVLSNGVRLEELENKVQGTQFEQRLNSIRANVEAIRGHQTKPLDQQVRALRDLGQRAAEDRRLARRFQLLSETTERQRKGFEENPYQTGTDIGIIQGQEALPIGAALQGGEEGQQQLAAVLSQRKRARKRLVEHTGMNIPLLREEEKTALEQTIQTVPAEQAAGVLRSMGNAVGVSSARRMAEDLAEKDELVGMATLLAPEAPDVATRILEARGASDTGIKLPKTDADTAFDDVVGGALPDGEFRSAVRSSSEALYKQLVLERGRSTDQFHSDLFTQATRMVAFGRRSNEGGVVGGPVEINNRKVLPPRAGMPRDDVVEAFGELSGERSNELVRKHGVGVPARQTGDGDFEQVDTQTFAEAQPQSIGDGRYIFQIPSDRGFIHAVDPETGEPTGEPFVFDMRSALDNGDIRPQQAQRGTIDVFGVEFDLEGRQGPPDLSGGRPAGEGPAGPGARGGARSRRQGEQPTSAPSSGPPTGERPPGDGPLSGSGQTPQQGSVTVGQPQPAPEGERPPSSGPLGGGARQDQLQPQPGVTEQTGRVSQTRTIEGSANAGFDPFRSADAPQASRDNTVPKPEPRPEVQRVEVPRARRAPAQRQFQALAPQLTIGDGGSIRLPDSIRQAEVASPSDASRGIRNNNPMNLAATGIQWEGKLSPDTSDLPDDAPEGGFERFRNPVMGIRAGVQDLLSTQLNEGKRTVRGIIEEHSLTQRDAYTEFVADRLGASPSERIDLTNPNTLVDTVKAIIEFENGAQPYEDSTIAMGAALAFEAKGET